VPARAAVARGTRRRGRSVRMTIPDAEH
jgi:hypothetical protein